MKESKFSLKVVFGAVCICLLMVFFYLSVLGENDKSKKVVYSFVTDIKDKNYVLAEKAYSSDSKNKFSSLDESMKFHFMLELSLLDHFDLTDSSEYAIKVKRDETWFPFFKNDNLYLSISLVPNDKSSILPSFKRAKPLKNFITATREDGLWKIKSVNINNSELKETFSKINKNIQLDKYVVITNDGFVLNQSHIYSDNINPLERKVIIHSLETVLETLRSK